MSQSQNLIYYTTAQVTDMVELSDQNVRKYVRLLEDRAYEVAKDEHNRRLFSKKDVSILQEMIKIAKSPGNTLDSAADQIIQNMDDFEESEQENQVAKMSDNDVSRLLTIVLEKLDEIQNENKELKTNISTLVQRLEDYDLKALEYNPVEKVETSLVEEEVEQEEVEEMAPEVTEEMVSETNETAAEEQITAEEEIEEIAPVEETAEEVAIEEVSATEEPVVDEADATVEEVPVEETTEETEKENTSTIDLSKQEEAADETKAVSEDNLNYGETAEQQIEAPKKGFFGKLASMFKG